MVSQMKNMYLSDPTISKSYILGSYFFTLNLYLTDNSIKQT